MNQVVTVGSDKFTGSWKKAEAGRGVGGQLCIGMAQIFHDALISLDIPARRVLLHRNVFDVFDTQTIIEAFVDGKLRLYDPTFHVALRITNSRRFAGIRGRSSWGAARFGSQILAARFDPAIFSGRRIIDFNEGKLN